jgi:very-short-patch-repair endonuclease
MHIERDLARESRRSYGILSLEQLLTAGLTQAQVKGACRRGSLQRILPKVYRVTSVPECWEQRPMAGIRWGGPVTVASGITAAFLHELLPRRREKVHLTSDHALHARPGFRVRLCRLLPEDLTAVRGIPCTSVPRTLVDVCLDTDEARCEEALDAALRMGRVLLSDLIEFVEDAAARKVRGSACLRRLLEVRGDDEALSESEFESSFGRLMRKGDLPLGERQVPREGVRKGRVDISYPEHNLVIELDGRKWHSARREKKRDKRCDNELNINGKRVLRLTWEDMDDEAYTLDLVARALGIRRLF